METRANYILIGVFALAGFLGMLGFFLWFARIELDRQFAYFDVRFTSVSGLAEASEVRFSGLPVGQVVDVRLSPDRDGTILVRAEVDAATPVRADSIATIESLGVTGVSYLGIGPGSPEAPLLAQTGGADIPVIASGRSTLQALTEDAPSLITETLAIMQEIGGIFTEENADRIGRIIVNAESASAEFAETLESFSGVAEAVNDFAGQINRFNETLDQLTSEMNVVLSSADDMLASIDTLAQEATAVLRDSAGAVTAFEDAVIGVERFIAGELPATARQTEALIAELRAELARLGPETSALIATLDETGRAATARLGQAEGTLNEADRLIARLDGAALAVESAAARIDSLIAEDGAPLLAETRTAIAEATATIAAIRDMAEADLPVMMARIADAVDRAGLVADSLGRDLAAAGADLPAVFASAEETMAAITTTFAEANRTLSAINGALATGDRMLAAAESAFTGADLVISEDIPDLLARLDGTLGGLELAVGAVASDIPAISADLAAASEAARSAFARLSALVDGAAPEVAEFATVALPAYRRLAEETRALVAGLDRLAREIERSPARFFLEEDLPDFRR